MAEQDSDRSEQATPHKLEEARKKGSVARSTDFVSFAMLGALAVSVYASAWPDLGRAMRLQQRMLARAAEHAWTADSAAHWLGELLAAMLALMAPFLLTLVIVALLANLLQTGAVLSFEPLKPDFERLNPAAGFKRVFALRTVFETIKSVIKLALLTVATWLVLRAALPGLVGLPLAGAKGYLRLLTALAGGLLVKLTLVVLIIGLLDLGFVRWDFAKRMRMSRRDIKDEHKNREGDPRIRARIRELRKEMLKRSQSVRKVAGADVLITNPTRLAVALSYQHGTSAAPQVVAKGAGELARKMRAVAARRHIPIVQNRALARALFREVGHEGYVPEKLYPQIAKIMVWVYALRAARQTANGSK